MSTKELPCPFCDGSGFNGLDAYEVGELRQADAFNPGDTCEYCAGFGTLPVLDLGLSDGAA